MCSFVVLTDELRPAGGRGAVETDIDPRNLIGRKAFDRNGTKIGTIDEVYLDDATGV
ncbi:PRC-barrel domain-containing protein, partial [Streptomyces murinus]|uniref:PRC-barrel domain-containing protein n=1 Tax=Streptomyces murinus TaxID=33900 RepID=UPI00117D47EA